MLKFSMEKHRVTIDPVTLTLSSIRDIWNGDRSRTKEEAIKLLSYIHICAQIDSNAPFYKSAPGDVEALAKKEIFGDYEYEFKGEFDAEFIEQTIFEYRGAFETPEQAATRAIEKKIHQINSVIDSTDIVIKEVVVKGGVQFVSNFPIINKMIQDLSKINAAKVALMNIVKGQQTQTMKGEKEMSYLEKKRLEIQQVKIKNGEKLESVPLTPSGDEDGGDGDGEAEENF